jgi:hypothetical protein
MFTVKTNPTFPATLTIIGQGIEQKLNVVFRHRTKDERAALAASLTDRTKTLGDCVLDILESWDADVDLNIDGLELLESYQPGAAFAIWEGYFQALMVARKGN